MPAERMPLVPPAAPLTDGSVVVRLRREEDVDALAAASHDPETVRWLEDPPMDAQARRTALDRAQEAWRTGRAAPLTIADALTDEAIGVINLQFRDDGTVTVAYHVFPGHRGHGIAPRAVALVAGWALGDLAIAQLTLEADAANAASVRVAEKSGFHATGTRSQPRADGTVQTTVVFTRSAGS